MVYLIVQWKSEEMGWEIVHWSHKFNDAVTMYFHFKKKLGDVQLFVDCRAVQSFEGNLKIKKMQEEIKRGKDAEKDTN